MNLKCIFCRSVGKICSFGTGLLYFFVFLCRRFSENVNAFIMTVVYFRNKERPYEKQTVVFTTQTL